MNNIGKNNFEFTGIQAGTKVLVSRDEEEWQERIFLTSIQGAWYPYICVAIDYEDDYLHGKPFEVNTWFDLKEIQGEKTIVLPPLHFSGHSNAV
jgi:hypothetical protein